MAAKDAKKSDADAKKDKGAKDKGKKGKGKEAEAPGMIALWTQRARGVGLLLGFAFAFLAARQAGLPWADATIRGVIGAFIMSVVAWWCTLLVIQSLLRTALVKRNEERYAAAHAAQLAAQEAAAARSRENDDRWG